MKKLLLILMTLCTVSIGYSQTFVDSSITYIVTSTSTNTVEATDYNTGGGTVVNIPDTVINNSITYNVTSIGDSAFESKGITSITIPDTITTIGIAAFGDNQLNSVTLFNGLIDIGVYAFGGNQLTNIIIPDSVTSIGSNAFMNNQLTGFTLPNNITAIKTEVFRNNLLVNVSLPNTITSIGAGAFRSNQLTNVSLGNSVATIGNNAFRDNQLAVFAIPESVTSMGIFVFGDNPITSFTSLAVTPPTIISVASTNDTFGNLRGNIHLHIPPGTMGAYVTNAGALWTGFNPVTEDAVLSVSNFELANEVIIVNTVEELKVISSGSSRLKNYTIYSITGVKIKEGTETTIAKGAMSNGIYIIELIFDKGRLAKKFFK